MAHYKSFQDLEIWKKARNICKSVYALHCDTELKKDYGLWHQLNKSTGSVMDNIAEGFDRDGNKEFIQFLSISKASCAEAISQLYRCKDRNYVQLEQFESILEEMNSCKSQIGGFMKYLKNSDRRGHKYD